ncbi:helix-turn-helix domain-containing protein [Tumebacillus permanentifrigoris]|uniref:helix-turn-helix domain-containing protein n=1 Tax=Tumebacillus permanentifrigoris TaxID=378543 RepID=UPI000D6AD818|nr:helix-turn-helix transcriptional regulator [Tumebacillus permanentifrigoris]
MSTPFEERLTKARIAKGYSQDELARKIGLSSQSSIANYENGSRRPSHKLTLALANTLGVTVDYLMGRSENPDKTLAEELKQSRSALVEIRNLIAEGKVSDIPANRIEQVVRALDLHIESIPDSDNTIDTKK